MATPNSLGLNFDQLNIQDPTPASQPSEVSPGTDQKTPSVPTSPPKQDQALDAVPADTREKKKPYVNAERVKTGGSQRDKLSEEALTERMARMREQNEKIKQRRLDVQADEDAFRKTQETERAKLAQIRKVQENVDRTREQNAKRKMDKMQSREWDSGKPTGDWKHQAKKADNAPAQPVEKKSEEPQVASPQRDSGGWERGSPRGSSQRGRGRGRGRGSSTPAIQRNAPPPPPNVTESPNTEVTPTPKEEASKDAVA